MDDDRLTMLPAPCACITRNSCFMLKSTPSTLVSKVAAKLSAFCSVTGPGALAVEVTNHSSLSKSEVETVQRGLRVGLASFGARFVSGEQAAATVRVSLSEDLQNHVWIAEIKQAANESSVAMISAQNPDTGEFHNFCAAKQLGHHPLPIHVVNLVPS